ncbi:MAG: glutathione binding-like protein [Sandaracinaceae bacterium]
MTFPSRWAPEHPDRIQLYSVATPNGKKIGIALEEMGLPYEAHRINIMADDQFDPEYLLINPNGKIPSIVDPNGPGGEPLLMMESGAILIYLAEKSGKLLSSDPTLRWETIQWLFFQMASVGPMFGQFGHFYKFAKDKTTDSYGVDRYTKEAKRLLHVMENRLEGRTHLVGDALSIADIATVPWVEALDFYEGKEALGYGELKNVPAWVERVSSREAYQRGAKVNGF